MSGSWDRMIQDEQSLDVIMQDHGAAFAKLETIARNRNGAVIHSVMFDQGFRAGIRAALGYTLWHQTHHIEHLTIRELILELRKGPGSIYWPVKAADPKFWGTCDRCRTNQLFDARGLCDGCGYDMSED